MTHAYSLPPFNAAAPCPSIPGQPAYDYRAQAVREIVAPGFPRCRYPKKDEVIQVLAGEEWISPSLRLSSSRQQFVLLPSTSVVRCQIRVLRVAVTALGSVILWPTLTEKAAGYPSQHAAIQAAERGWVRIWKERDGYRHAKVLLNVLPVTPADPLEVLAEQAGLRPQGNEVAHARP
jgi:hypothetical protein